MSSLFGRFFRRSSHTSTSSVDEPAPDTHKHIDTKKRNEGKHLNYTNRETRSSMKCGHNNCQLSDPTECCMCGDKRPYAAKYQKYVDGKGWITGATRDEHYCPGCRGSNASCPHSNNRFCDACVIKKKSDQLEIERLLAAGNDFATIIKCWRTGPDGLLDAEKTEKLLTSYHQQDSTSSKPHQKVTTSSPSYSAAPVQLPSYRLALPSYDLHPAVPPSSTRIVPLVRPPAPPSEPIEEDDNTCKICFEASINAVLIPCGHLALCITCANSLQQTSANCPICRAHVHTVVQTFRA
eukprot:TRINITY_DN635_c0_g1_i2.p1 TRINITY_DN635_c0_g1~~TRINITY_DN635_c0_g1_i2.p1  ORF type:complete len:294 (+),score=44.88 TRINITY_DN635_c0_g1_i2:76-957(+)